MSRMNIYEKINTINEERNYLISSAVDAVLNNKMRLRTEIRSVINIIKTDNEACNKSIELAKAQNIIDDVIDEIVNSNSKEDIIKLRNRLNYYINKIKNIMKQRGMSEKDIEDYSQKVTDVRKSISKYLRFVKRNENIETIDFYLALGKKLTKPDINMLKKTVQLEYNYNKRCLRPPKPKKVIKNEEDSLYLNFIDDIDYVTEKDGDYTVNVVKSNNESKAIVDYLDSQVNHYDSVYNVLSTHEYNGNIFENISALFKNIPIYKNNTKVVNYMETDFKYHGAPDLQGYIDYIKKHNSIKYGLKQIISKTKIHTNAEKYLNTHQECINWIIEYCNSNDLFIKKLKN